MQVIYRTCLIECALMHFALAVEQCQREEINFCGAICSSLLNIVFGHFTMYFYAQYSCRGCMPKNLSVSVPFTVSLFVSIHRNIERVGFINFNHWLLLGSVLTAEVF